MMKNFLSVLLLGALSIHLQAADTPLKENISNEGARRFSSLPKVRDIALSNCEMNLNSTRRSQRV